MKNETPPKQSIMDEIVEYTIGKLRKREGFNKKTIDDIIELNNNGELDSAEKLIQVLKSEGTE